MACISSMETFIYVSDSQSWGISGPQGTFGSVMTGGGCATDMWVEAKDAPKHLTMYWTGPTTKNSLAQSVNSAEIEKVLFILSTIDDTIYII